MERSCPSCRKPVPEGASDCPACGRSLSRVCSCGAAFDLAAGRCPACGARHRTRRGKRTRLRLGRRAAAVLVLAAIAAGVGVWLLRRPNEDQRLNELFTKAGEAVVAKNYSLARGLLGDYLAARPEDARALYFLGICRFGLGEEEAGAEAIRRALELRPTLPGARLFLARTLLGKNMLREAVDQAALAPEPEGAALHARLLVRLGRLEDASRAWGEAIARAGGDLAVLFEAIAVERRLAEGGYAAAAGHRQRAHALIVNARRVAQQKVSDDPSDPVALYARARAMDEAGLDKPEEVEEAWRSALAADRANPELRGGFAAFLARQSRRGEAAVVLEEGMALADGPKPHLMLADFLASGGERDRAVEVVAAAAAKWPEDPALRAALVGALMRAGRNAEARRTLDEAAERFGAEVGLLEVGGDLMLRLGDRAAADDFYARALKLAPRDLSLLRKRIAPRIDRLAIARSAGGDLPEDLKETALLLTGLRALNPWDREGLRWEAELARARGRNDLALSLLDELLRYHPDDTPGRSMRGEMLFGRGEMRDASAELKRVVESKESSQADFRLFVRAALPFGRFREIAEACERGIERWPDDASLYGALGFCRQALREPDRFLRRIEAAGESVKSDPEVRLRRGWCLAATGRGDEAEEILRGLLGADPAYRAEYARLLMSLGREGEAEQFLRSTLAADPESPQARLDLAEFLLTRSDREGALRLYSELVERDPENTAAVVRFGEILVAGPLSEDVSGLFSRARDALRAVPGSAPEILYLDGLERLRARDGAGAEDRLARYVRLRPASFEGHFHLATACVLLDRREDAADAMRTALSLRPGNAEARKKYAILALDSAFRSLRSRDAPSARKYFEESVATGQAGQGGRVLLGLSAFFSGQLDVTAEEAEAVLKESPDDGAAWLLVALVRGREGKAEEALAAMDRVVALCPDLPVVRAWRGFARLDAGNATGALDDLDAAKRDGLDGPGLAWGRAHALAMLDRKPEALETARGAARTWPEAARAHRALGEMLLATGDSAGAAASLLRAFDLEPADVAPLVAAASLLLREGKPDEAERALGKTDADRGIVLRVRGDLLRARGQVARAEDLYRRAAPDDPGAYVELAKLAEARGDEVAARQDWAAAVQAGVDDPGARFAYGTLLAKAGKTKEARDQFEAILRVRPDHVATLNNLAAVHLKAGERDRAKGYASRAHELAPGNPAVADTLGWILHLDGAGAEALALLEAAAKGLPGDPEAKYHLGMALARAGRNAEAKEALAAALRDAPSAPWSEEAVRTLRGLGSR